MKNKNLLNIWSAKRRTIRSFPTKKMLLGLFLCFAHQVYATDLSEVKVMNQAANPKTPTELSYSGEDNQKIKQTGVIVDAQGEPIIGASIIIKGTTNGTISDLDGNFSLNVEKGAKIEISYISYKMRCVVCNGKPLRVILEEDTKTLDEVVVVGFGSQKKVNLTGAVSAIDEKVFDSRPVSSAAQMLQGAVAGLNITGGDGLGMNSDASISVRGVSTIGEGSSGKPLILIDGMEGDLNSVNPQDIATVSVLKDATSSSIYGSRAPFGVILITTKSGKAGKTTINYNNNLRWSSPLNLPDPMDSYEYAIYMRDADRNGGKASTIFSPEKIDLIKRFQQGEDIPPSAILSSNPNRWGDGIGYGNDNVNHFKEVFRNQAFSQEHNLSVKGGTDKLNYYFSANYSDENGFFSMNQESRTRITTTAKLSAQLFDWMTLKITNRFATRKFQQPMAPKSYDLFWKRLAMWPCAPAYDYNGNMFDGSPLFFVANEGTETKHRKWIYQQYQLQLEPIKDWKTFIDFNYKYASTEISDFKKVAYVTGVDNSSKYYAKGNHKDSYIKENRNSDYYINLNIYSQYNKTYNELHNFKAMVGFQLEQQKIGRVSARRDGLIVDELHALDVTDGLSFDGQAIVPTVSGNYNDWNTAGFFGRLNYDYDGRYLAEVNMRYDGTSRFRRDNRWGFFPSASIGWNIARESFFEPLSKNIGTLKFRASYGELGNQNTNAYYPTYRVVPIKTAAGPWLVNGAKPTVTNEPALIYPELSWEVIKNWNFGLDISAFNNRLTGSLDYYIRDTKNMVGPAPQLPDLFGATVPKQNNTNLSTYGFECILSWRDVLPNNFSYGVSASLADSKTEITSYPNITNSLSTYRTGQTMGEIWGYETIGIAKTNKEMDQHLSSLSNGGQNALGTKWAAGDVMYRDLNGDKKINNGSNTLANHGDLKVIGNNMPRYAFSFTLDAAWKGFDVRAFFQGILKRDYFLSTNNNNDRMMWGASMNIYNSVGLSNHLDYFRNEPDHELGLNTDAFYPRPLFYGSRKNQQVQSRYLMDASYLRFKNLQLGYTLPNRFISTCHLSKVRVYGSVENLMTFTSLPDMFDPETITGGLGGIAYPLARTWAVGINVVF